MAEAGETAYKTGRFRAAGFAEFLSCHVSQRLFPGKNFCLKINIVGKRR